MGEWNGERVGIGRSSYLKYDLFCGKQLLLDFSASKLCKGSAAITPHIRSFQIYNFILFKRNNGSSYHHAHASAPGMSHLYPHFFWYSFSICSCTIVKGATHFCFIRRARPNKQHGKTGHMTSWLRQAGESRRVWPFTVERFFDVDFQSNCTYQ